MAKRIFAFAIIFVWENIFVPAYYDALTLPFVFFYKNLSHLRPLSVRQTWNTFHMNNELGLKVILAGIYSAFGMLN